MKVTECASFEAAFRTMFEVQYLGVASPILYFYVQSCVPECWKDLKIIHFPWDERDERLKCLFHFNNALYCLLLMLPVCVGILFSVGLYHQYSEWKFFSFHSVTYSLNFWSSWMWTNHVHGLWFLTQCLLRNFVPVIFVPNYLGFVCVGRTTCCSVIVMKDHLTWHTRLTVWLLPAGYLCGMDMSPVLML
jgi:hypothetical protein